MMPRRKKEKREDGGEARRGRGRGRRPQANDHSEEIQVALTDIVPHLPLGPIKVLSGSQPGGVRASFVLPVANSDLGRKYAEEFAAKMGIEGVTVLHSESVADQATCYQILGQTSLELPRHDDAPVPPNIRDLGFHALNNFLRRRFERKLVVVGACLGPESNPVSLDTLFNVKGYMGHWGLEGYDALRAFHLRAQPSIPEFCKKLALLKADAVYVTCLAADKMAQLEVFKDFFAEAPKHEDIPKTLVTLCGSSRLTTEEARGVGFDAHFVPGTVPLEMARFIGETALMRIQDGTNQN